jgi:two-component system KDP operon response regulator KdpE
VITVLVVDDDPRLVRALRINLAGRGYAVTVATTGAEALQAAAQRCPDIVSLDLVLPEMSGLDVLERLRKWSLAPVIVLSGRTDPTDNVRALDDGADDYLTKPFGMDEFLARLRAVVRRSAAAPDTEQPVVQTSPFTVDLAAENVTKRGVKVRLTPAEWGMLKTLVRNRGNLVGQAELLTAVWSPVQSTRTGRLRVHLVHLRRKLEDDPAHPKHLLTEAGMGYRFQP